MRNLKDYGSDRKVKVSVVRKFLSRCSRYRESVKLSDAAVYLKLNGMRDIRVVVGVRTQ